ncbi:malonyl-CoA decarboxylase [Aquisalimonas asiatica]|uniref:Malonyl-CoA decarboxylase n=1 Tax=Aquisalimonas asiatica TaxID=406100 RepID=A0A1H8U933_9GAMM|nr:malonyl-CoA decarboxylase [Aquisalimonas asiatica]SEO99701.1 malonyl-CoA decarboxylase [Aquisalimonas asiatica]
MNGSFLNDLLTSVTQRYAGRFRSRADRAGHGADALLEQCDDLLASDGEVSGLGRARTALATYETLGDTERLAFFRGLAARYAPAPEHVAAAYARYTDNPDSSNAQALSIAARSARSELLRRLNTPPGHTFGLVRMRADLQRYLREAPELQSVDTDFMELFRSWFNRGFLVMRRIDWTTPAHVLEKIIAYEAVHAIHTWDDLRQRVGPDNRRCFGFFHPATGDEPLIFVQVALTRGIPDRVQPLLGGPTAEDAADTPAADADTATFFSISNCQSGLRGISFGNFLIKQVVEELRKELPGLTHFVTLSPMPGFADWVRALPPAALEGFDAAEQEAITALVRGDPAATLGGSASVLRKPLMQLATRYLVLEKNRDGLPLNPVSRFHLGNGAEVHRVNWLGDASANGLQQSFGMMVNYLYRLDDIERNHEAYATEGRVACSKDVQRLTRQAKAMPVPA